jgi:hypothetical protein
MKTMTLPHAQKLLMVTTSHKTLVFLLFFLFLNLNLVAQIRADVDNTQNFDPDICRYYPADVAHKSTIKAPIHVRNNIAQRGPNCSNFIVTYNGFTPQAEAAFQFAVDIWSNLLESSVDIRVDATFGPLNPGVLGGASPNGFLPLNGPGIPPNTLYPRALAEKIIGAETADGSNNPSNDISATFSSTANFYFGLDANPPSGQVDFVSVVLHELGHGLGIVGFARVDDNNNPTQGLLRFSNFIGIWDNFIENGTPAAIASFSDPSAALLNEYTSNDLFCNSALATAQNGNLKPSTHAPATFQQGSSYSHWDEATYPAGHPNSLMTPSIAPGEAIHDPGSVTLGFMEDMGWSVCGGTLNVDEFSLDTVQINPNPFTSSIAIKLPNGFNDDYAINLYDINGRVVFNKTLAATNGNLSISNLDNLENALYFVNITNTVSGKSITKKVIKN